MCNMDQKGDNMSEEELMKKIKKSIEELKKTNWYIRALDSCNPRCSDEYERGFVNAAEEILDDIDKVIWDIEVEVMIE